MYTIYKIECSANQKAYVGRCHCFEGRVSKHFCNLRGNRHTNKQLQADFNKYGEGAFKASVLETTLDMGREREWMLTLRTNDPEHGYNELDPCFGKGRWGSKA